LFTPVCANIHAHLAAVRADTLGLGQFVMPGHAGQMGRQAAAAMRSAAALRLGRRRRCGRRCRRVLARDQLREQQGLAGVEALATRPVQATQQQVESMPQGLVIALTLVQRGQQLQDHALERARVVGQVLGARVW
jgi:hypothetical protein